MAVRKSASKTAAKKKAPAKAAGSKKTAGKKAAPKKTAGGAAKRPASKKAAASSKPAAAKAAAATPPRAETPEQTPTDPNSSLNVNMGHVFSLRPRVRTSFRPADLHTARHLLSEERFDNIEAAARAVAEKALDLTHKGSSKRGFKPGR